MKSYFYFFTLKYWNNELLFTFTYVTLSPVTFTSTLSNFFASYFYFFLSTQGRYLLQHWSVLTRFYRTTHCMRLQYEPRQCSPISVWRTRVKTAKISSSCFHRLFFGPIALGVERLSPTKLVLMIGDVIRERLFLLLCSKWRTVECHLSSRKLRIHKQMIACA